MECPFGAARPWEEQPIPRKTVAETSKEKHVAKRSLSVDGNWGAGPHGALDQASTLTTSPPLAALVKRSRGSLRKRERISCRKQEGCLVQREENGAAKDGSQRHREGTAASSSPQPPSSYPPSRAAKDAEGAIVKGPTTPLVVEKKQKANPKSSCRNGRPGCPNGVPLRLRKSSKRDSVPSVEVQSPNNLNTYLDEKETKTNGGLAHQPQEARAVSQGHCMTQESSPKIQKRVGHTSTRKTSDLLVKDRVGKKKGIKGKGIFLTQSRKMDIVQEASYDDIDATVVDALGRLSPQATALIAITESMPCTTGEEPRLRELTLPQDKPNQDEKAFVEGVGGRTSRVVILAPSGRTPEESSFTTSQHWKSTVSTSTSSPQAVATMDDDDVLSQCSAMTEKEPGPMGTSYQLSDLSDSCGVNDKAKNCEPDGLQRLEDTHFVDSVTNEEEEDEEPLLGSPLTPLEICENENSENAPPSSLPPLLHPLPTFSITSPKMRSAGSVFFLPQKKTSLEIQEEMTSHLLDEEDTTSGIPDENVTPSAYQAPAVVNVPQLALEQVSLPDAAEHAKVQDNSCRISDRSRIPKRRQHVLSSEEHGALVSSTSNGSESFIGLDADCLIRKNLSTGPAPKKRRRSRKEELKSVAKAPLDDEPPTTNGMGDIAPQSVMSAKKRRKREASVSAVLGSGETAHLNEERAETQRLHGTEPHTAKSPPPVDIRVLERRVTHSPASTRASVATSSFEVGSLEGAVPPSGKPRRSTQAKRRTDLGPFPAPTVAATNGVTKTDLSPQSEPRMGMIVRHVPDAGKFHSNDAENGICKSELLQPPPVSISESDDSAPCKRIEVKSATSLVIMGLAHTQDSSVTKFSTSAVEAGTAVESKTVCTEPADAKSQSGPLQNVLLKEGSVASVLPERVCLTVSQKKKSRLCHKGTEAQTVFHETVQAGVTEFLEPSRTAPSNHSLRISLPAQSRSDSSNLAKVPLLSSRLPHETTNLPISSDAKDHRTIESPPHFPAIRAPFPPLFEVPEPHTFELSWDTVASQVPYLTRKMPFRSETCQQNLNVVYHLPYFLCQQRRPTGIPPIPVSTTNKNEDPFWRRLVTTVQNSPSRLKAPPYPNSGGRSSPPPPNPVVLKRSGNELCHFLEVLKAAYDKGASATCTFGFPLHHYFPHSRFVQILQNRLGNETSPAVLEKQLETQLSHEGFHRYCGPFSSLKDQQVDSSRTQSLFWVSSTTAPIAPPDMRSSGSSHPAPAFHYDVSRFGPPLYYTCIRLCLDPFAAVVIAPPLSLRCQITAKPTSFSNKTASNERHPSFGLERSIQKIAAPFFSRLLRYLPVSPASMLWAPKPPHQETQIPIITKFFQSPKYSSPLVVDSLGFAATVASSIVSVRLRATGRQKTPPCSSLLVTTDGDNVPSPSSPHSQQDSMVCLQLPVIELHFLSTVRLRLTPSCFVNPSLGPRNSRGPDGYSQPCRFLQMTLEVA